MDNRYYENVINEIKPFFEEQNFKPIDDYFKNDKIAVKISYNDKKQVYSLFTATVNDNGSVDEFKEINTWLFDDSQNEKDAESVGIDFTVSLRKELGIKSKRTVGKDIELPTASKSGRMTVTGLSKKMLDVYPSLKDNYKEHISIYGNFLYLNFFGEFLVPNIKETLSKGTKKQISKLFDVFEDGYVKGDNDTVNTIIAVLCAAAYNDSVVTEKIRIVLEDNKHFLNSFNNFLPIISKNKKIKEALIK